MKDILFLFDVDGTLTPSREKITEEMKEFLTDLKKSVLIGFVGGSDLAKQEEQLGEDCIQLFDYCFPENGLHYIRKGDLVSKKSYLEYVGEETHCKLVNSLMSIMSKINLPKKRGVFIELRTSMVNVSPIGRSCTREERKEFCEYDKQHKVRENIVQAIKGEFPHLTFSIGGEISIDIFPSGWDKTYCLTHLDNEPIRSIYFFGDMVHQGGNDHEIYSHHKVNGTQVTSPEDTIQKVKETLATLQK
ncbi:phosphomannomutase [Nematocida sp. AWRm80]|nr:phosphomannomutase [Nematocida sp. AWRm80]